MLAAGTNVQWLRDDLGLIDVQRRVPRARGIRAPTPAASCSSPRCSGSARPAWDYGAPRRAVRADPRHRRAREIVRAVLEGIAHRGADLVEAAEADAGIAIPTRARRRRHDRQPDVRAGARRRDATPGRDLAACAKPPTLGAALMAGLAVGHHGSVADLARTWSPRARVEPNGHARSRPVARSRRTRAASGSPSSPASTSDPPATAASDSVTAVRSSAS